MIRCRWDMARDRDETCKRNLPFQSSSMPIVDDDCESSSAFLARASIISFVLRK